MKPYFIFHFLLSFLAVSIATAFPSWTLTVVYPDQEKKEFLVPENDFTIKMKGSKWRCIIDKAVEQTDTITRGINCRKNNDMLATPIMCTKNQKNTESGLLTLIEGKNQYTFLLSCSN